MIFNDRLYLPLEKYKQEPMFTKGTQEVEIFRVCKGLSVRISEEEASDGREAGILRARNSFTDLFPYILIISDSL
jgi:hypothetical protein